jgi:hypothetical protein
VVITLASGVLVDVQRLNAVLQRPGPFVADGLVVPTAVLRDRGVLTDLAQKLKGSSCAIMAVLGQGAERVHDDLDDLLVGGNTVDLLPSTTWHENEDAEDVLRLIEHMALSSEKRPAQPSILVISAATTIPTDLPGLLKLLAAELG